MPDSAARFVFRTLDLRPMVAQLAADLVQWNGAPITDLDLSGAGESGGLLTAWLDGQLYRAFVVAARSFLTDAQNASAPAAVRAHALSACGQAVADAYNAVNVPMSACPVWSGLYRQWIAGMPATNRTGVADGALWSPGANYSGLVGTEQYPTLLHGTAGPAWATVPAIGRATFDRYSTDPATARTRVGVFEEALPFALCFGSDIDPSAYLTSADFLTGRYSELRFALAVQAAPSAMNVCNPLIGDDGHATPAAAYDGADLPFCRLPTGAACAPGNLFEQCHFDSTWAVWDPDRWQRFTSPLSANLAWLDAIVSSLEARDPERVVVAARLYAAWCNKKMYDHAGGQQRAIREAMGNASAIGPGSGGPAATLRAVGTVAAAAGAAVGTVTGGVGALIGGAIALTATVASAALDSSDLSALRLDMLRRPKPVFERGWLSGDAGDPTSPPTFYLPAPAGYVPSTPLAPAYTRVARVNTPGVLAPQASVQVHPRTGTPTGGGAPFSFAAMSTPEAVAVAGAVAAVGVLALRRFSKGSSR